MPPGFVPPASVRGGQAVRPAKAKIPKPKAITPPRPKPIDPNQAATNSAMNAFHVALNQLKASTPPVDSAGIYAPYRASEAVTGQLGTGLQSSLLAGGQAAQQQYATGRDEAQKQAAAFGISAGAGANPTALTDNGTQMLASQTQAQAAAAPMASAQWQQELERAAAGKVSDATLARQTSLTSAEQSLATTLPSAIGAEKDRAFSQDTAKKNFALAVGTAKDKQTNDLRDYLLGVTKAQTSATTAAENTGVKKAALAQKTANDAAKLRVSQDTLALKKRTTKATASGLKGVAAAAKALSGTTSKAGTKKVAKGWDVQVVSYDPEADTTGTKITTVQVPDKRHAPAGFKIVPNTTAKPHYDTVPTSAGSAGLTASAWDAQMRSLLAQNPGRAKEVKAFLGPRPKK